MMQGRKGSDIVELPGVYIATSASGLELWADTTQLLPARETWTEVGDPDATPHAYPHATGPGWTAQLVPVTEVAESAQACTRAILAAHGDTCQGYYQGFGALGSLGQYIRGLHAWYLPEADYRYTKLDGTGIVLYQFMRVADVEEGAHVGSGG